jgi:DNA primase catalytic core
VARIKDASVEAVKNAAEILPLVEDYVRLRKAGGTYKGLCPFHQEKSPSFTVSPARGTYKCFGCGEGGDAISFVTKLDSLDFVGAIEVLAKRFGVELEYEETSPEVDRERRRKEALGKLLERATGFYERLLWDSEQGAFARAYLESRGLGEEVCRAFRLGYAPGGDTLARGAIKEGFTRDDLLATGLGRGGNDYFQRRLLFPLTDARGNVRGFQARKLYDDDRLTAKYVNSPESDLFKKGDLLYGLDTARQAMAKDDRAVIVEGNTDVIALRQAGFLPVVASMGTALTEKQLKELQRLTKRLFLCFDSDAAGREATLRGMELAAGQGFDVKVVPLPKGSDPADDPATFQDRLAAPVSYLVHRVRLLYEGATDKQAAFATIKLFLNAHPDSPEHLDARQLATDLLGLPPETQATFAPSTSRSRSTGTISPRLLEAGHRLERSALAGVALHPSLNKYLEKLSPEHFDLELHRRARAHLLGGEVADSELTPLIDELYALAGLEDINEQAAEQMLLRLQERHLKRELDEARPDHMGELQQRLAQVRTAIREFA